MLAFLGVMAFFACGVMGAVTREEVNALVPVDHGVYIVTEETYNEFVNWNPRVLLCFHYNTSAE